MTRLDVFSCHGLAGMTGAMLTGVFATKAVNPAAADGLLAGNPGQMGIQASPSWSAIALAAVGTVLIFGMVRVLFGVRPAVKEEISGLDVTSTAKRRTWVAISGAWPVPGSQSARGSSSRRRRRLRAAASLKRVTVQTSHGSFRVTPERLMARVFCVGALSLSLVSCGDLAGPTVDFITNKARWDRVGPATYTYVFQRQCFCGGESIQQVRITVSGNQVTAVVRVADGQSVPPEQVNQFFRVTIDSLFGLVGHAIDDDAHDVDVTYDPRWGYPTAAFIDYEANTADEEQGFTAALQTP